MGEMKDELHDTHFGKKTDICLEYLTRCSKAAFIVVYLFSIVGIHTHTHTHAQTHTHMASAIL